MAWPARTRVLHPFVLGLLIASATTGPVVGVIAYQLSAGSQYLWLMAPLVVLVCTIAVMSGAGTKDRRKRFS